MGAIIKRGGAKVRAFSTGAQLSSGGGPSPPLHVPRTRRPVVATRLRRRVLPRRAGPGHQRHPGARSGPCPRLPPRRGPGARPARGGAGMVGWPHKPRNIPAPPPPVAQKPKAQGTPAGVRGITGYFYSDETRPRGARDEGAGAAAAEKVSENPAPDGQTGAPGAGIPPHATQRAFPSPGPGGWSRARAALSLCYLPDNRDGHVDTHGNRPEERRFRAHVSSPGRNRAQHPQHGGCPLPLPAHRPPPPTSALPQGLARRRPRPRPSRRRGLRRRPTGPSPPPRSPSGRCPSRKPGAAAAGPTAAGPRGPPPGSAPASSPPPAPRLGP